MNRKNLDIDNELKLVAGTVSRLIQEDPFPESILPEGLRDAVRAYPSAGGKRIRPALLLWSCALFGGDPEKALPAAAAAEIYHNWTLVHDDIIDEDDERRGMPTAHTALALYAKNEFSASARTAEKFGKDLAILAGDLQQAWAVDMLLRLTENGISPSLTIALARRMQNDLGKLLISGEALDVAFALPSGTGPDGQALLSMIAGKTSALLRFCLQTGAAIALDSEDFHSPEQTILAAFAENLGAAYQIRDDLLGVYGNAGKFGKPLCSDFQENKITLLLLAAKQRLNEKDLARLQAISGLPEYTPETIRKIRGLLSGCGAEQAMQDLCTVKTRLALESLESLPDNRWRNLLEQLTERLLNRNR